MNCVNNHLTLEQQVNRMLRTTPGANGLTGIATIKMLSGYTNKIPCDLNHLSFTDLLLRAIGVDSCGKPAIRVVYIATCNPQKDCNNNAVENQLTQCFAYDVPTKSFALVLNQF